MHSYAFSLGLYAVVLPYLLVPTYLYFRQAFLSSFADLRPLFEILPWALLFLGPALAMRHFTEERKQGSYELLMANPISEEILVAGKFLSVLVVLFVLNSFFLLIPALISPFASLDFGKITSEFIGLLLLSAFIASLSLAVSSFSYNQYAAFLLSSIATIILYLLSADFVNLAFPGTVRTFIEFLSPLVHYENFLKGVIDFSSVIYFIGFIWFWLYIAALKLKSVHAVRPESKRIYAFVWFLSGLALFAFLLLSYLVDFRIDATRERIYTLSSSTRKVLADLDSRLVIKVYASRELPPEMSGIYRDIKGLLSEYRRLSRGRVEVLYLEPDVNPRAKLEASNYGIPPIQFNVISNEEYRVKEGYFGLAVLYGPNNDTVPVITSVGDFELKLTTAIYNVTRKNKQKIGIVSDSGAKNQISGLSVLSALLSKQYEVEEVFANRKEYELEKYDVLVIAGPLNAYESTSVARIKEYLNKGGSLFVAVDTVRVNPQAMSGENANLNINDITGPFGITFNFNLIMDLKNFENAVVSGENSYVIPYPFWLRATVGNNSLAKGLTSGYRRIILFWPSSIEVHRQDGFAYYEILKTTDYGAEQEGFYMVEPTQNFEAYLNKRNTFTLAVATERTKDPKTKIFAVGDGDFIDDSYVRQNQENLGFALAAIHWLAGNEVLLGLKQKNVKPEAFSFPSKEVREAVRYATFVMMVVLWLERALSTGIYTSKL